MLENCSHLLFVASNDVLALCKASVRWKWIFFFLSVDYRLRIFTRAEMTSVGMRAKQTIGKCVSRKAWSRREDRTLKCLFFLISAQNLCFGFKFRLSMCVDRRNSAATAACTRALITSSRFLHPPLKSSPQQKGEAYIEFYTNIVARNHIYWVQAIIRAAGRRLSSRRYTV